MLQQAESDVFVFGGLIQEERKWDDTAFKGFSDFFDCCRIAIGYKSLCRDLHQQCK